MYQNNCAKSGRFVISTLQFGVTLCKKTRKSIKGYAKTQNKRTKTCAFRNIVVSLHQKKKQKQIKPQDPEGQRDYEDFRTVQQRSSYSSNEQPEEWCIGQHNR